MYAAGLNPADRGAVNGLSAEQSLSPPRGIGLDFSRIVHATGGSVRGLAVGDRVLEPTMYSGPSDGAADSARLAHRPPVTEGQEMLQAAALPTAGETA